MGSGSNTLTLFNFLLSIQILSVPSGFFAMTTGDAYGDVDPLMISNIDCMSLNDSLTLCSQNKALT